jgi:hypothetical protein
LPAARPLTRRRCSSRPSAAITPSSSSRRAFRGYILAGPGLPSLEHWLMASVPQHVLLYNVKGVTYDDYLQARLISPCIDTRALTLFSAAGARGDGPRGHPVHDSHVLPHALRGGAGCEGGCGCRLRPRGD